MIDVECQNGDIINHGDSCIWVGQVGFLILDKKYVFHIFHVKATLVEYGL